MPEVDLELKNLLKESYEERAIRKGFGLQDANNTTDKVKKLEHTQKLLGKQSNSVSQTDESNTKSGMYNLTRDERQRDLQTMDVFRERWELLFFKIQIMLTQ